MISLNAGGLACFVCVFALVACERSASSGALTPGSTAPATPPPAEVATSKATAALEGAAAPAPPAEASACATIVQRFRARRMSASGACSNDSDCGCFNGVDPDVACGGVTDATSAKALAAIEDDFHRTACTFSSQCAAWQCQPKCTMGKCVR